jgi:Domain of unknown function (DUF6134)
MKVMVLLASLMVSLIGETALADDYVFEVLLDGNSIGSHRFEFESEGTGYRLTSTANYVVKILFVPVYRYQHRSQESWRNGCLQQIQADTNDNGESYRISGGAEEGGLALIVNDREVNYARECIRTFAYWQPALLNTDKLLNSQTGELNNVTYQPLGQTPLPWDTTRTGNTVRLQTPDGDIHLWYRNSRWLGLLSTLASGRELLYRPVSWPGVISRNGSGEEGGS